MKRKPQDLTALLIAYDTVNRRIERIQNDNGYIEAEAERIFKDRTPRDYHAELTAIIDNYL